MVLTLIWDVRKEAGQLDIRGSMNRMGNLERFRFKGSNDKALESKRCYYFPQEPTQPCYVALRYNITIIKTEREKPIDTFYFP